MAARIRRRGFGAGPRHPHEWQPVHGGGHYAEGFRFSAGRAGPAGALGAPADRPGEAGRARQSLCKCARAVEGGHGDGAGTGGDDALRAAFGGHTGRGKPSVPPEESPDRAGRVPGRDCQRGTARDAGAAGSSGLRAADCVRERGEFAAGARRSTAPRDCSAGRDRRGAGPAAAAVRDRGGAAFADGRAVRYFAGLRRTATPGGEQCGEHSAGGGDRHRLAGTAVYAGDQRGDGRGVWPGSGGPRADGDACTIR